MSTPDATGPSPFAPADNATVIAHVNLLQGVINRLAGNSSSCKTWCITLVAALLSLAGATHVPAIVTFALVPVIVFGFMDTMYLAQERAYRKLFAEVVGKIRQHSYGMADVFEARAPLTFGASIAVVTSWSIYPVYGGLLLSYWVAAHFGWFELLAGGD